MQSSEYWFPVPEVPECLAGAVVVQPGYDDLLVICDGQFKEEKCLVLSFFQPEAFMVHEEFAHPWLFNSELRLTVSDTQDKGPISPFFKVIESEWAANSNRMRIHEERPTHYVIASQGHIVEILSLNKPKVRWVAPGEIDELFDRLKGSTDWRMKQI